MNGETVKIGKVFWIHDAGTNYKNGWDWLVVEPTPLKNMLVKLDQFFQVGLKIYKQIETTTQVDIYSQGSKVFGCAWYIWPIYYKSLSLNR